MASSPEKLRNHSEGITYSPMWDETNSRKDGTIKDDIHFPTSTKALIYSSPFIGVTNPLLQVARQKCQTNRDYDPIDLTDIPADYMPRVKYSQACTDAEYEARVQKIFGRSESRRRCCWPI